MIFVCNLNRLPIYNLDNLHLIPNDEFQFTINYQLFLETFFMEIRGNSISFSSLIIKHYEKKEKEIKVRIQEIEENSLK